MMSNKKKGIGKVLRLIITLPIMLLIGLFFTVGLFQLGEQYVVDEIYNISYTAGQDINISTSWLGTMDTLKSDFDNINPPFEALFTLLLITAFGSSIFVAINARPLPTISFLGSLLFGLSLVLLVIVFIDQFATWYLNDFFYVVFDEVDNLLLTWYLDNLSLVSAVWFVLILFLNQINLKLQTLFTGKDEGGDIIEE